MNNKINPCWNHAETMSVNCQGSFMTKMTSNLLHSIHLIILVFTVFKWQIDEDSFIIS